MMESRLLELKYTDSIDSLSLVVRRWRDITESLNFCVPVDLSKYTMGI